METKDYWFFQLSCHMPHKTLKTESVQQGPHSSLTRETYSSRFRAFFFLLKINVSRAAPATQEFRVP